MVNTFPAKIFTHPIVKLFALRPLCEVMALRLDA
jgi:hypothetical protein